MPSENYIEPNLVVKLEKAERWQQPPVLRRELLHAGSVTEIRLLERQRQDGQDGQGDGADGHR